MATDSTTQPAAGEEPATRDRPTHDEIAERAYHLHREDPDRDDVANWLAAERELEPNADAPSRDGS